MAKSSWSIDFSDWKVYTWLSTTTSSFDMERVRPERGRGVCMVTWRIIDKAKTWNRVGGSLPVTCARAHCGDWVPGVERHFKWFCLSTWLIRCWNDCLHSSLSLRPAAPYGQELYFFIISVSPAHSFPSSGIVSSLLCLAIFFYLSSISKKLHNISNVRPFLTISQIRHFLLYILIFSGLFPDCPHYTLF